MLSASLRDGAGYICFFYSIEFFYFIEFFYSIGFFYSTVTDFARFLG